MRMIISIANHKGGTGKTTTCLNMASALNELGFKVVMVDLDPQHNLTYAAGWSNIQFSIYDFMMDRVSLEEVLLDDKVKLIPGSAHGSKLDAISQNDLESLANASERIKELNEIADFVLIDCPPSNGFLTRLALASSDQVIIPILLDVLSIQGLNQILTHIQEVQSDINPQLKIGGVLGVLVDGRRQLTTDILEFIRDFYEVIIFNNFVRANVRAAEAPSYGKSVIEYAPNSSSARDYMSFTREFLRINELSLTTT